jgi:MFS family permease
MGLGIGVVIPAVIMLAMAGAQPQEAGLVSGLTNTAQQAGAALGLAVLAVVAARVTEAGLATGSAELDALRDGYARAYLTAAGFAIGALLIVAFLLRRPAAPLPRADATPDAVPTDLGGVTIGDCRESDLVRCGDRGPLGLDSRRGGDAGGDTARS